LIAWPAEEEAQVAEPDGYTAKRIDEMEGIYGGSFKRARAELGVTAFGMQVIDMPPNLDRYPEHDHSEDGQEEVYIALSGEGTIEVDGDSVAIDPGTMVRVGPGVRRKVSTGEKPLRLLVLGGIPGGSYEAPDITKLGEPDPLAG
jgi:mannose-6-phosphate isomerase-like protein (cupin superfamily)